MSAPLRVLVGLLAAWGLLLSGLLWAGKLPAALTRATDDQRSDARRAEPAPEDGAPSTPPASTPPAEEPPTRSGAAPGAELERFAVCPREEGAPRLSPLRDASGRVVRWAVHCGPEVHLIAFDRAASELAPRRVARLSFGTGPAGVVPSSSALASGDIDGDGTLDLVLAQRWLEASGAPAAGALYVLAGARSGGLAQAPERVVDAAILALQVAPLDGAPGDDIVALHASDPRLQQPTELWLLSGGAAVERRFSRTTSASTQDVLIADLDGDTVHEVIALAPARERVELHELNGDGAPVGLSAPGLREGLVADVDGDGDRDLLLLGGQLWARWAGADEASELQALALRGLDALRQLALHDTNADGKLDLVGYAHPALVSYEQIDRSSFVRRELLSLTGASLAVFEARLAELDGRPGLDLLLLAAGEEADGAIELVVAGDIAGVSRVHCPARVEELPDAPLTQWLRLP